MGDDPSNPVGEGQVCRYANEGRDVGDTPCTCGDHDDSGTPFWRCNTPIH